MTKKEIYETPRAEVIRFEDSDIIKTSGETTLPKVSGSSVTESFY